MLIQYRQHLQKLLFLKLWKSTQDWIPAFFKLLIGIFYLAYNVSFHPLALKLYIVIQLSNAIQVSSVSTVVVGSYFLNENFQALLTQWQHLVPVVTMKNVWRWTLSTAVELKRMWNSKRQAI